MTRNVVLVVFADEDGKIVVSIDEWCRGEDCTDSIFDAAWTVLG